MSGMCLGGACSNATGCLRHEGLPIGPDGLCVEGRRLVEPTRYSESIACILCGSDITSMPLDEDREYQRKLSHYENAKIHEDALIAEYERIATEAHGYQQRLRESEDASRALRSAIEMRLRGLLADLSMTERPVKTHAETEAHRYREKVREVENTTTPVAHTHAEPWTPFHDEES